MSYSLEILDIQQLTHDVKQFKLEKPLGYSFTPGQATEVSIDKRGWREHRRPFTFTSTPEEEILEFVIKIYPEHGGVTKEIESLEKGDSFLIGNPWGTIQYNGKGTFFAGGAGITPFISIFRYLYQNDRLQGNKLIFANKSEEDIILSQELRKMLEQNFHNVITQCKREIYANPQLIYLDRFIDRDFLQNHISDINQHFYVCGPPPFNKTILNNLEELGADPITLTFEN